MSKDEPIPLARWHSAAKQHHRAMAVWCDGFRDRRKLGQSHPVEDFLFIYYRFSPAKLQQWHPGVGVCLQGDLSQTHFSESNYTQADGFFFCDPAKVDPKVQSRLVWTVDLLKQTQARRPNFSCLGLHEWAMVYQGTEVRHEASTDLRLSQQEIDEVVQSRPLTCTHFDAFRFFADSARPLNKIQPTLESRPQLEQPACIHANMDLYKWAFKSMPWIGTQWLVECFHLAMSAREIDMRASPYDLTPYGDYPPIKIETAAGRAEYERHQRAIAEKADPVRSGLIKKIEDVLALIEQVT